MSEEKLYDVKQAAERLGITPAGVRYHAGLGHLGKKLGSRWIFTDEDLEQFRKTRRPYYARQQQEDEPDA